MKTFFFTLIIFLASSFDTSLVASEVAAQKLKILHLTFHKGCAKELETVCQHFGHNLETWFIQDLPQKFLDGSSSTNALYNMGHNRASAIWNLHAEKFKEFDVVITSDTAPLARIFLQNNYPKHLIIWVCNRFDYHDQASLDCDFPDSEFYQLMADTKKNEKVFVVAYTAYEHAYAASKGIDLGNEIITPSGISLNTKTKFSLIKNDIDKESTFFLPPYHNESILFDFSDFCKKLNILTYCGRYNGASDLQEFKGIIHLPYAWSNLALFENLGLGIPYFIPSPRFFKKLILKPNYFFTQKHLLTNELLELSEWYEPDKKDVFIYFDSWKDLVEKIKETNYPAQRERIKKYAAEHQKKMLKKWEEKFDIITNQINLKTSNFH
jgi:hypothetical protein